MRKGIMKIICGTDFSVHAAEAANVAASLAARQNSRLTLLHAVEPARVDFLSKDHVDHLRAKLGRKLVAEGNRLRKAGADVGENLVFGRPHEVIVESAKRSKARLIVVSSLGQIAVSRLLVGSVAERTAQNATVPTLVVRDYKPLTAWAQGKRTLNIFVCYDFSPSSDAALRWVASLKDIGRCRITVSYVSWPPTETWRLGIGGHSSSAENPPEVKEVLERDLKERCAGLLGKRKVKLVVASAWGSQENRLIEMARSDGADLIVVGTNQRRGVDRFWLGSVSRGILYHAPMNVACVPMADDLSAKHDGLPAFRRVLVSTDFSKLGNKAVLFACGAAQRGGEVCLIHVIPSRRKRLKNELSARLESLIPERVQERGIQTRIEVVEHEQPAVAICQAAERFSADLICIGSRGCWGLKKKFLGSVAEAVMRRSSRPVLVIRS
jgi:nucleotide-binding universal stress UspA family protein